MMKSFFFIFLWCIFLTVYGKNPLGFPEYKQIIEISYSDSETAKSAELQILPLPDGKKIAYTARWDDTIPANLKMSALLKKHGLKGTFMLHGTKVREQGKKLLADGHAIGNHTENHYWLPLTNPNQIFYETAIHQVRLETELQTSVVSYVFPFGAGSDLFKDFPGTCLRVFDCANLYVFPFYWKQPNKYFNRSKDSLLATRLFASNDRKPTVEFYRSQLAKAKKEVDPAFARVTHGIHVWMQPRGFEELDKAFAETVKDPDFIFMTENEYGAYRYSMLHADLQKKKQRGNTAFFEITRFQPGYLGAAIPLTFRIKPTPEKVKVGGIVLKQAPNGYWQLPHAAGKSMPKFYEWLKDSCKSGKMPGLQFDLFVNKDLQKFTLRLNNKTGKALNDIHLQLSLPPKWLEPKKTYSLAKLDAGKSFEHTFDAGKKLEDPDFSEGIYHFIARLDFEGGRIYRTKSVNGTKAGEGIHTFLRYLGPFPKAALTKDLTAELSLPNKLEPITWQGKVYPWKKYSSTVYNRYSFDLRDHAYRNKTLVCPAVAEFNMDADGEVRIAMYRGTELYCNGAFVGKQRRHYKIKAKKGRNRLFLPHAAVYESIVIYPPAEFVHPQE